MARRDDRVAMGFTLIELMISIALMVILTGTITFVFIQAQDTFVTLDARVQVYQEARSALDQMERDIANSVRTSEMEFYNDRANRGHYDPLEEISTLGTYDYALTVRQPPPYSRAGRNHDRDSLYFRTIVTIEGQTKEALVEYALRDTDRERPVLVRRTRDIIGVDPNSGDLILREPPDEQILCQYVTDIRIAFFYDDKRTERPGRFYTPTEAVNGVSAIDNPRLEDVDPTPQSISVAMAYHSGGIGRRGVFSKADNGLFYTEDGFTFPALEPGDRIYVFNPTDSRMPSQDYTIKQFRTSPTGSIRIEFREPIDMTSFTGDVYADYRAGFLPPAVHIELRIKDFKAEEERTISRVFKLLKA